MNYSTLLKNLLAEVKSLNQYKEIKKPFNVLAFIAVLPFTIASFFISLFYIIFDFLFNGIASCARYLEKWVDEKKKDIHPASEAVLFFITMPTIFFFNVLLSGFALFYYFTWFVLQVNLFVATLGGTRWQPYIANAEFGEEDLVVTTNEATSGIFAIASFSLFILTLIMFILAPELGATLFSIYEIGILVAVPLIFKKAQQAEEAKEIEADEE